MISTSRFNGLRVIRQFITLVICLITRKPLNLKQATQTFSVEQKNVIVQMDEIHIKLGIAYKGGKLLGSSVNSDDPTKTVFAIMFLVYIKKWSCVVLLLPFASNSGIKSCIRDIELCRLLVQVITTDNYPLNVKLLKLFSPFGKPRVCHYCEITSNIPLFPTFDLYIFYQLLEINY